MDEMVHENAEQIAQLYQQVQRVLDGTNICTSGDIYFFKIHNKIAELSINRLIQNNIQNMSKCENAFAGKLFFPRHAAKNNPSKNKFYIIKNELRDCKCFLKTEPR